MIYKDPITGLDVCDECECSIENGKCLCWDQINMDIEDIYREIVARAIFEFEANRGFSTDAPTEQCVLQLLCA